MRKLTLLISFSQATPLHSSAFYGQLEVVRLLVESKADVAARDRCFSPPPSHHLSLTICLAAMATLHSNGPSTGAKPTLLEPIVCMVRTIFSTSPDLKAPRVSECTKLLNASKESNWFIPDSDSKTVGDSLAALSPQTHKFQQFFSSLYPYPIRCSSPRCSQPFPPSSTTKRRPKQWQHAPNAQDCGCGAAADPLPAARES